MYKSAAQAFSAQGHPGAAARYLDLAEGAFRLVLQDPPADAIALSDAWNGMGSVLALRGDYPAATQAIERAVGFNPDNYFAWHDLLVAYASQGPGASRDLPKVAAALENLRRTAPGSRIPEADVRAVEAWAAEIADPQRTAE